MTTRILKLTGRAKARAHSNATAEVTSYRRIVTVTANDDGQVSRPDQKQLVKAAKAANVASDQLIMKQRKKLMKPTF